MPRERKQTKDKYGRDLYKGESERKGGTYQYRKWNPETKKTQSVSAPTLKELRQKEKQLDRDIAIGVQVSKDTVNDYYRDWIDTKHLKKTAEITYRAMYDKWLKPEFGQTKITDMKHSKIKAYYNRIMKNNGLSSGTLGNINNILRQILQEAVHDNVILKNPCDDVLVDIRKNNRPEPKTGLTIEEQERFIEVIGWLDNREYQPLFLFMLDTGLRIGEVAGLTWKDTEGGTISVRRNLEYYAEPSARRQPSRWHVTTTKTPASVRDIPINKSIRKDLDLQRDHGYKNTTTVDGVSDFVFSNKDGHPLMDSGVNSLLRTIVKHANQCAKNGDIILPTITAHTFRHTFTSNMVRANVGVASASVILGHANFETTMDIYNQVQDIQKQEAMEAMDDFREHME